MNTHEYIVTIDCRENLENFYNDMETAGCSCAHVPEREVECCNRREISRNTHYMLTDEEAELLRGHHCIKCVDRIDQIPELTKFASQTSYFNRGFDTDANHTHDFHQSDKNWGLYRHFIDTNTTNWGEESGNASAFPRVNATISWDLEGQDVDIIINDDVIDPDHPEYAVNADGTGGSRVQSIDWTDYLSTGSVPHWKSFLYDIDENHGALCASSAAGNTHGLARKANLFSINSTDRPKYAKFKATRAGSVLTVVSVVAGSEPIEAGQRVYGTLDTALGTSITISSLGTGTGGVGTYNLSSTPSGDSAIESDYFTGYSSTGQNYMWDYIRAFHKTKPVNSVTNMRNPTIVNASYGSEAYVAYANLTSVNYRGTTYNSSNTTWTNDNLWSSFGIVPNPGINETDSTATYWSYADRIGSLVADIEDAIEEGILIVAASGNSSHYADISTGQDYDNYYNGSSLNRYQRGGLFGETEAIYVGALDNEISSGSERKADFSNTGPRIDTFAPGVNIIGTDSGDDAFGKIISWSRTNNVITFNTQGENYNYNNLDYTTYGPGVRIKVEMDTTTSLNGYYMWGASVTASGATNPTGFTVGSIGPDVALTTENGSFHTAAVSTSAVLYDYKLCDSRDETKYLYHAGGTSFAAPMATGLAACWMGYYGRLDREEFKALVQETGAADKMTAGANYDWDDRNALIGAGNYIQRYAQFRATTGYTYPQNTHKARSTATVKGATSYQAFPRQRTLRYGS
jgi:hypothetical protein|tara:strand:- start:67 stop:2301 length:2235 start_codon:yes stop_codon:yes gene_type:complete